MNLSKKAMQRWLLAAGLYNVLWGAWVIFFPYAIFDLTGAERPSYPELWQCIGMIVGVYGVGYLAATSDPLRHWPIVLVGLMGKILGPIGFVEAVIKGTFPLTFGLTIISNDLVWWLPFFSILRAAYLRASASRESEGISPHDALMSMQCERARCSLASFSMSATVLLVFLRHHGCTFCREAIQDLSTLSKSCNQQAQKLVFVTTGSEVGLLELAERYSLKEFDYVLDPSGKWYGIFSLKRGTLRTLFGFAEFKRALVGAFWRHRIGFLDGDGFQLPGVFVLKSGKIVAQFRHNRASDRPPYCELIEQ